jgi:hypothetical protein
MERKRRERVRWTVRVRSVFSKIYIHCRIWTYIGEYAPLPLGDRLEYQPMSGKS